MSCSIDVTTLDAPSSDQFEIFRSTYHGVVDTYLVRSQDGSFPARQMVWDLGKLAFVRTELPGRGYAHRWQHVKRTRLDHWYVTLPFRSVHFGNRQERVAAPPSLHCLARPCEAETDDEGRLTLFIPRDFLPSTSAFDDMLDVKLESGLGFMLAEYLHLVNRTLPDLSPAEPPRLVEATRAMVVAALSPTRDRAADAQSPIEAVLMERARRLISRKLADPDLTPERVCAELGVSRSRLYRLFEALGGISAYIRRQRLLKTRDALSDVSDTRAIGSIAEEWGFVDASAFSRKFKQEFGISPREARETGWHGNGYLFVEPRPRSRACDQDLAHLLREISA